MNRTCSICSKTFSLIGFPSHYSKCALKYIDSNKRRKGDETTEVSDNISFHPSMSKHLDSDNTISEEPWKLFFQLLISKQPTIPSSILSDIIDSIHESKMTYSNMPKCWKTIKEKLGLDFTVEKFLSEKTIDNYTFYISNCIFSDVVKLVHKTIEDKAFIYNRKDSKIKDDFISGKWYENQRNMIQNDEILIPIILYSDQTNVAQFNKKSLHPIYITIGNQPTSYIQKHNNKMCIGYLPSEFDDDEISSKKIEIYHKCFKEIISIFANMPKIPLIINDQQMNGIIKLAVWLGDLKEKAILSATYGAFASVQRACPFCTALTVQFNSIKFAESLILLQRTKRETQTLINKKDTKLLSDNSLHPVQNAFWDSPLDPYIPTIDLLHSFDSGLISSYLDCVYKILKDAYIKQVKTTRKEFYSHISLIFQQYTTYSAPPEIKLKKVSSWTATQRRQSLQLILIALLNVKDSFKSESIFQTLITAGMKIEKLRAMMNKKEWSQPDITAAEFLVAEVLECMQNTFKILNVHHDYLKFHTFIHLRKSIEYYGALCNVNTESYEYHHKNIKQRYNSFIPKVKRVHYIQNNLRFSMEVNSKQQKKVRKYQHNKLKGKNTSTILSTTFEFISKYSPYRIQNLQPIDRTIRITTTARALDLNLKEFEILNNIPSYINKTAMMTALYIYLNQKRKNVPSAAVSLISFDKGYIDKTCQVIHSYPNAKHSDFILFGNQKAQVRLLTKLKATLMESESEYEVAMVELLYERQAEKPDTIPSICNRIYTLSGIYSFVDISNITGRMVLVPCSQNLTNTMWAEVQEL